MTDFKLHDGTYLDRGQEYEITMVTWNPDSPTRIKISQLDSRRERIDFYAYLPTYVEFVTLSWQEFDLGYQRDIIRKWNPIPIVKRLPPHRFA